MCVYSFEYSSLSTVYLCYFPGSNETLHIENCWREERGVRATKQSQIPRGGGGGGEPTKVEIKTRGN